MTHGFLSIVLHAHLPFVRHPEHDRFLEENWLFEAVVETYLPLIQVMDGWLREGMQTRLTMTMSPTLLLNLVYRCQSDYQHDQRRNQAHAAEPMEAFAEHFARSARQQCARHKDAQGVEWNRSRAYGREPIRRSLAT